MTTVPTGETAGSFNFSFSKGDNAGIQPIPSMTVVPSSQKSGRSPNGPSATMPISQTSSGSDKADQEEDVPLTAVQQPHLQKKINTKLRDTGGYVIDRDDPNSPLFSSKSFEELKIQPELLKGQSSIVHIFLLINDDSVLIFF